MSRELIKAMKQNDVDQQVHHSGMIVGNNCLTFGEKRNKIVDDLVVAMKRKIKYANDLKDLTKTGTVLKNIIQIWYELMLVMKSKKYQTEGNHKQFRENKFGLTKAI